MTRKQYVVVFGYVVFVFLAALPLLPLLELSNGMQIIAVGYAIALSTFAFAGAWGGLGSQSYLVRTLVGGLVVLALFLGIATSLFFNQLSTTVVVTEFPYAIVGLSMVTMMVAGQIPFLFLNWFAGWHLCPEDQLDKPTFSIQSLFSIVFVFALALACSQFAKQLIIDQAVANIIVGQETMVIIPGSKTGGMMQTMSMETVDVTQSNVEELRRNARRENSGESALGASVYTIIIGLMAIPILWFAFRHSYILSLAYSLIYAFGIMGTVTVPFVFAGGLNFGSWEFALIAFSVGLTVLLIWAPLALLKRNGMVLRTNWTNVEKIELAIT